MAEQESRIFISYRREDTAWVVGRLYDWLAQKTVFGEDGVFRDIEDIPFGIDFRKHIESSLTNADIVLVLVGSRWIELLKAKADEPHDFLVTELEAAYQQGARIIPVLVGNARMPSEDDLPDSLNAMGLSFLNAFPLREADFRSDVRKLIKFIKQTREQQQKDKEEAHRKAQEEAERKARAQSEREAEEDAKRIEDAQREAERKEREETQRQAEEEAKRVKERTIDAARRRKTPQTLQEPSAVARPVTPSEPTSRLSSRMVVRLAAGTAVAILIAIAAYFIMFPYGFDEEAAFVEAAQNGDLRAVRVLINRGVNLDTQDDIGVTALMAASEKGHIEVMQELISAGANVNVESNSGSTALIEASSTFYERTEPVSVLIEAGAKLDSKIKFLGNTALINAASRGHTDIVRLLIQGGAELNGKDRDGFNALMWAAYRGHADTVEELVRAGANINETNNEGKTALQLSALGRPEVNQILIDARADGGVFRDALGIGGNGPEMVVIPGGSFIMGSPSEEEGRYSNEGPQHQVTISRFALGRYPVTVAEFGLFVESTGYIYKEKVGCPLTTWKDPGYEQGSNHPVVCVSHNDATAYASWLTEQTGEDYRLPTEAEWEYAARGGTDTPFHTGECISGVQANFLDTPKHAYKDCLPSASGIDVKLREVGSYPANQFGLHDMHGSVWEWVEDCLHRDYKNAPDDGSAWLEADGGECSLRIKRGGSWADLSELVRSAYRSAKGVDNSDENVGFRIARDL
jgi:formylglycine-generating enzyme required for sulfatase activity